MLKNNDYLNKYESLNQCSTRELLYIQSIINFDRTLNELFLLETELRKKRNLLIQKLLQTQNCS